MKLFQVENNVRLINTDFIKMTGAIIQELARDEYRYRGKILGDQVGYFTTIRTSFLLLVICTSRITLGFLIVDMYILSLTTIRESPPSVLLVLLRYVSHLKS